MKPYQSIPIQDCGEPLVPLPPDQFDLADPHFYQSLGAPYADKSPFYLRQGVLAALLQAQATLAAEYPGWRIRVFDAFRPVAVQQFMVDYTFRELVQIQGLDEADLSDDQRQALTAQVYQFWAPPSPDPAMPPPHSTGAAVDVTLVDQRGSEVDMGSPIDEISARSFPDHFAGSDDPSEQQWHRHRTLLNRVMVAAGFRRHPQEWWHFSLGDQLWTWLSFQAGHQTEQVARYGRAPEPLEPPRASPEKSVAPSLASDNSAHP
ncbi:MAG: D-alanyl-D-alanine dipeptidase [Cyanobacteria bacterium Co-bin8]|nr:D-alanyl-D-alanine dipeptidase [Cyanobacteria bacterium Co-bin8]